MAQGTFVYRRHIEVGHGSRSCYAASCRHPWRTKDQSNEIPSARSASSYRKLWTVKSADEWHACAIGFDPMLSVRSRQSLSCSAIWFVCARTISRFTGDIVRGRDSPLASRSKRGRKRGRVGPKDRHASPTFARQAGRPVNLGQITVKSLGLPSMPPRCLSWPISASHLGVPLRKRRTRPFGAGWGCCNACPSIPFHPFHPPSIPFPRRNCTLCAL